MTFRVSNYLTINHERIGDFVDVFGTSLGDNLIRQFLDRQNWDTLLVPKESNTKLDNCCMCCGW